MGSLHHLSWRTTIAFNSQTNKGHQLFTVTLFMTHKPISLWRQNMAFKQKQFLILPSQHYVSSSQKKCNCSNVRVSKTILVFPKYDIYMYNFLQKPRPMRSDSQFNDMCSLCQAELLMWNMLKPIPSLLQIYTHKRTKKVQNTHNLTKLRNLKCQHVSMIPCSWVEATAWETQNKKENHNTISTTCHLSLESLQVRPLASQWISPGIHQASLLEEDWMFLLSPAHTPSRRLGGSKPATQQSVQALLCPCTATSG